MARRRPPTVHGVVLIDKPAGMTSHDVVNILRRHFGEKRIGHTGTLDPDATGLLVVGVGNATRLFRFAADMDKSYSCEIVFGTETDTLDDSGEVVAVHGMGPPDIEVVRAAIAARFVGTVMQVPPMVSAVRVDGVRLHELARRGIEVDRQARPVTVDSFTVAHTGDEMVLAAQIRCGSGTYIRSLAADLGRALGGGAHIRRLRRHGVGPFTLEESSTIVEPVLLPVDTILRGVESHELSPDEIDDVLYGRVRPAWEGPGPWVGRDGSGGVVAVFERWRDGLAKPTVVFGGR